MIDIRQCHVCNRKFVVSDGEGFTMTCESCPKEEADVCRKCAKKIILKDITGEHIFQFEELPEPSLGGLILEAYSEVTQV